MTSFVRDVLRHYHMAPSQLVAGDWRVVLSFQVLYNLFLPDVFWVEDFSALYSIRRTKEGGCYFDVSLVVKG